MHEEGETMAKTTYKVGNKVKRYSNKDYDPQKAHEYYMKHRKLKGRNGSGASINTLSTSKAKTKIKDVSYSTGSSTQTKQKVSTAGLNEIGRQKVNAVKSNIKQKQEKALASLKSKVEDKIRSIQESIKSTKDKGQKEALRNKIKQLRESYKTSKENIKSKYNKEYAAQVQKIKQDTSNFSENSTAGLTAEAKAKAKYIKEKLSAERKEQLTKFKEEHRKQQEEIREAANRIKEQRAQALKQVSERAKMRIQILRDKLQNMTPEERKLHAGSLRNEIYGLQKSVNREKNQIKSKFDKEYNDKKQSLTDLNTKHKEEYKKLSDQVKKDYTSKYTQELKNLKKNAKNLV